MRPRTAIADGSPSMTSEVRWPTPWREMANGWNEGRCGWPLEKGGRCRNLTLTGTARCWRHQGEWTKRGKEEENKARRRRKVKKK